MDQLPSDLAEAMAALAVDNLDREYPNAPAHLLHGPDDLRPPRELHPAFFGSYDWHSCVHQHWLLVRLLRLGMAGAHDASRAALASTLTSDNLAVEAAYLRDRPSFERTYGWAWLLALATELAAWDDDASAARWASAVAPAVDVVRGHWLAYLGRAPYPIRAGTHASSAFGLLLALGYAAGADGAFEAAIRERAIAWFEDDRDAPARFEPGGDDFLSPTLVEAVLMRRVLGDAFAAWFDRFLPEVPPTLRQPATVADRSDAKTVHLDGLNLSRAWCWRELAGTWPGAEEAARVHLDAALPHLFSGEYVGEHWVSTFALLALTGDRPRPPVAADRN